MGRPVANGFLAGERTIVTTSVVTIGFDSSSGGINGGGFYTIFGKLR